MSGHKELTKEEIIYMAGVFDARATYVITRKDTKWAGRLRTTVIKNNESLRFWEKVVRAYGGRIDKAKDSRYFVFETTVGVIPLLKRIIPYARNDRNRMIWLYAWAVYYYKADKEKRKAIPIEVRHEFNNNAKNILQKMRLADFEDVKKGMTRDERIVTRALFKNFKKG